MLRLSLGGGILCAREDKLSNRMSKHILIVDDDALMRRSLAFNLQQAGYQASTAGTAEDALALASRQAPDLVLLDIGLPGMDGLEALRQFKDRSASRSSLSRPAAASWMRWSGWSWGQMIMLPSRSMWTCSWRISRRCCAACNNPRGPRRQVLLSRSGIW